MKAFRIHLFILMFGMSVFCSAVTYQVGPGKAYAKIGDVPLESITAGDIVQIYWQATPYKEKWVIAAAGAMSAPVVFEGVANAGGLLPIIDGEGAVTRLALDYWNENRSVIKVGGSSVPSGTPSYVTIRNLDIRSGRPPFTFSDDGGSGGSYNNNAASVHIESGSHITIDHCIIHNSGNGLFVSYAASDIVIQNCYIYDNGNSGSIYEHNAYTEAGGILYQYNHFGPLRSGCSGNNLKDRSAGTVIRCNWIESGNRQLDLVDTDYTSLRTRPDYDSTFVYGNILIEHQDEGNSQIIHFGGDSGEESMYRKNLYLFNNTIVSTRSGNTTLLRLSTNGQFCDCRNNILYVSAAGVYLAMLDATGQLALSANYLKPGWQDSHGGLDADAGLTIASPNVTAPLPGFIDAASQNYHLTAGSVCLTRSVALSGFLLQRTPDREYVEHQSFGMRLAVDDLGAFDCKAIRLRLRALLQGPYDTATHLMNTSLNATLPLSAPYAAAPRTLVLKPGSMVDWILVSLSASSGGAILSQRSFLLDNDGTTLDFDEYGTTRSTLLFPALNDGAYFLQVSHRNHLTGLSAAAQPMSTNGDCFYDFTAGANRYFGGKATEVEPGLFALWAGDANQDGMVSTRDYVIWYNEYRLSGSGYASGADLNCDAATNLHDYLLWTSNAALGVKKNF